MRDKILKEALNWYEKQEDKSNIFIEDFVDLVINTTTNVLIDEVQEGLKDEFNKGNLKHPFIISSDYYLYLKLKEIKYNFLKNVKTDPSELENLIKKSEEIKDLEK